jgi:hypothetical protein
MVELTEPFLYNRFLYIYESLTAMLLSVYYLNKGSIFFQDLLQHTTLFHDTNKSSTNNTHTSHICKFPLSWG